MPRGARLEGLTATRRPALGVPDLDPVEEGVEDKFTLELRFAPQARRDAHTSLGVDRAIFGARQDGVMELLCSRIKGIHASGAPFDPLLKILRSEPSDASVIICEHKSTYPLFLQPLSQSRRQSEAPLVI